MKLELNELELLLKRIQMMDKDATPQEIEKFIQSIADEVGLSVERIDN